MSICWALQWTCKNGWTDRHAVWWGRLACAQWPKNHAVHDGCTLASPGKYDGLIDAVSRYHYCSDLLYISRPATSERECERAESDDATALDSARCGRIRGPEQQLCSSSGSSESLIFSRGARVNAGKVATDVSVAAFWAAWQFHSRLIIVVVPAVASIAFPLSHFAAEFFQSRLCCNRLTPFGDARRHWKTRKVSKTVSAT